VTGLFLWQKYNYKHVHVDNDEKLTHMIDTYDKLKSHNIAFDTETTGLNIMIDTPFLIGFGFDKCIFTFEPKEHYVDAMYRIFQQEDVKYVFAHNAKFDYHMMINMGKPIPDDVPYADSLTVARLTEYADVIGGLSLKELGKKLVDEDAGYGQEVIREHVNKLKRDKRNAFKAKLKNHMGIKNVGTIWKEYNQRIPYVKYEHDDIFKWIDENYKEANYEDSYKDEPNLMINYLADDIFIILEVRKRLWDVLTAVDVDLKTFERENKLIKVVADVDRQGLRADIPYLLESLDKITKYIDVQTEKMHRVAQRKFLINSHQAVKNLYEHRFQVVLKATDRKTLQYIIEGDFSEDAKSVAKYILELRSLEKYKTTYIEGMLKRIINGRVYTEIKNAGTITGRVSSNLQQQPSKGLYDEQGNEIFHPRRAIQADENKSIYYLDFKGMELRIQAMYTLLLGEGDLNLCRAFIPYKCKSFITNEMYDINKDADFIHTGEWLNENDEPWEPVDVHTETTLKAFPDIKVTDKDFKNYRLLGKRVNFLKNYGGMEGRLKSELGVSDEIAQALDQGYYKAFPRVLDYQKWVDTQIRKYGYVENLFGRRYYMQYEGNSYKCYNYLIQGFGADFLKTKELEIFEFLKKQNAKTKMALFVHDEIQFHVPADEEETIIPEIKRIMENNKDFMKYIPLPCDVEKTTTNWAEKEAINIV
jgi:DNA polymerase I